MIQFRPKDITFDCYGTLTRFRMPETTTENYGASLAPDLLAAFIRSFAAFRMDGVFGAWKPYGEVIASALERACGKHGVPFREEDARRIYEAVPTWGPHPDVPAGLGPVAERFPLVILSNASDDQIMSNVEMLGAPFPRVFTAEQAGA